MEIIPLEDDVLWAFLNWLNSKNNADFCTKYRPDKMKGANRRKEIDYIAEDRITGKQIAIEESSFWRHEKAGKEAADWTCSIDYIKQSLSGRVKGSFDISTPFLFFVSKQDRDNFSNILLTELDLLATSLENSKTVFEDEEWYNLAPKGPKPLDGDYIVTEDELPEKKFLIRVCRIPLKVNYDSKSGSMVDFVRTWEDYDRKLFSKHITRILKKKEVKLEPYRNRGLETWLVIYSTMWTTTNDREIQNILNVIPVSYFTAIDHIVLVGGNPPDNVRINEFKIPGRKY